MNRNQIFKQLFLISIFCSIFVSTEFAQTATADLSGIVGDEQGAVVPNVTVRAINTATNLERETVTNKDGAFIIPLLPPGNYTLRAEATGFAPVEINDITLNVGDVRSIRIGLKVGAVGATVTVYDSATLIDESSAVSTLVDRQFVENQPLNGRSFQTLIELVPGVVVTPSNVTSPGQFSVNGQRTYSNYFTVDGVSANFGIGNASSLYQGSGGSLPSYSALGGTNTLVSVDAVQEFAVQTSTFAAEFGRQPGGQVQIATRSGTNRFSGSVFNYFRNDIFDANDWFNNANSLPRPALRQNDFGFTLGGKLSVPSIYDGKDRTFFFISYEGLRLRQPVTSSPLFVPTQTARQNAPANVRAILNAFPLPNSSVSGSDPNTAAFTGTFSNPATINATSFRLDHSFSKRFSIFGRFNYAPSESRERAFFATPNTVSLLPAKTKTLTIGSVWIASSKASNDLRVNFSQADSGNTNFVDSFGGATVPAESVLLPSFASVDRSLGIIGIGDATLNLGINSANRQRQFNIVNNFSWTVGSHSLKFGADYRRVTALNRGSDYLRALFFDTVDDVLAGTVSLFVGASADVFLRPVYDNYSFFAQDKWRVNQRLTLSYGVRYEINPAPSDAEGNLLPTVTGVSSPSTVRLAPNGTRFYRTTYNNFAPRFGAAYQIPKWNAVIRGGIGLFYDLGYAFTGNAFTNGAYPFGNLVIDFALPLSSPVLNSPLPQVALNPPFGDITAYQDGYKLPYSLQFNVTGEKTFAGNNTISASYLGSFGRRLPRVESLRDYAPDFPRIDLVRNASESDYHALQLQFQRRLSKGLQALTSYTFAKSLDDVSDETQLNLQAPIGSYNPRLDRAVSDFDVRHSWTAAISYNLPNPLKDGFGKFIFKDFSVDGIFRYRTATPVNVFSGNDRLGLGISTIARPNLVAGVPFYIQDRNFPGGRRVNAAAFQNPAAGQQGNLGRNALRGFSAKQFDISIRRQFNLFERLNLQIRLDAFNVFNTPNFANPSGRLNGPNFGVSTQMLGRGLGGINPLYQVGGQRSLQLALKLNF